MNGIVQYSASTAVPRTYTHHDVELARAQGVEIGWILGLVFMIIVLMLVSAVRG